jgi:hypothetical protein
MKLKTNFIVYLFLFNVILLTSCFHKDCCSNDDNGTTKITGTGDLVEQKIGLSTFTKINLTGAATITVIKGDTQSVKLRAQQNVLDVMVHEVNNGIFFIGYKNNCSISTSKGIFVDVVTPNQITDVSVTGAGKLNISGNKQESFNAVITSAGEIYAYNLEVNNCSLIITGAGSGFVWADKKLDVTISGAGTVTYKGHPSVSQIIAGVGVVKDGN